MQRIAVEQSRLHIPLIFGLDIIHGYRTAFPIPLGCRLRGIPTLIERIARVAAQEGRRAGIRWTFSPMVDIARDARWGRIAERRRRRPVSGIGHRRGLRARIPGHESQQPRYAGGLRKTFRGIRRGRRRTRLQHRGNSRAPAAAGLLCRPSKRRWRLGLRPS